MIIRMMIMPIIRVVTGIQVRPVVRIAAQSRCPTVTSRPSSWAGPGFA